VVLSFPNVCRVLTWSTGAFALLTGVVVLIGWAADLPLLRSVHPSWVQMKANAAVGLAFAGLALVLSRLDAPPAQRRLGRLVALVPLVIGLLTVTEYGFAVDLDVDQLLFVEPPRAFGTLAPGRMAPNTAIALSLLGAGLLTLDRPWRGLRPAQWCAVAIALISLPAILVYAYGVHFATGLAHFTHMAIHTVLAVLGLCVGLLAARPDVGWMREFSSTDVGGTMARRLAPVGLFVPLGLGFLSVQGCRLGFFDMEFGLALAVIGSATVLVPVVLRNARMLDHLDVDRRQAWQALAQANADLEQRVEIRTAELVLAREQALAAAATKGAILANVSHEIRTPMHAMLGMTELLQGTQLTFEQSGYIQVARQAGDALLLIIDDVLDLSRIESGQIELDLAPVDLEALVGSVLDMTAVAAHAKDLALLAEFTADLPRQVLGDRHRIAQILSNLMGNAVKFTARGHVSVQVERIEAGVRIRVADTGEGIAHDKLSAIFDPFTQADSSVTRRHGGTGLGLAIVRRLVSSMSGEVTVQSQMGQGTEFTLSLPLPAVLVAAPATCRRSAVLPKRKVLVVDGYPPSRAALGRTLAAWGLDVQEATDLDQAEQSWLGNAGEPHIVILDLGRGWREAALQLAAKSQVLSRRCVCLCLVPTDDRALLLTRLQRKGFTTWLPSPPRRNDLHELLAALTQSGSPGPADLTSAKVAAPDSTTAPPHRLLRVLVVDDAETNRMLLRRFLKDDCFVVAEAVNGQEALDAIAAAPYDVVLMDMSMPVLDGYAATRALRAREQAAGSPRLPVIALTAHAIAGDEAKCLSAGCDRYVAKPVRRETLLAAIRQLTATQSDGQSLEGQQVLPQQGD